MSRKTKMVFKKENKIRMGREPWNKGLTKEIDKRVERIASKLKGVPKSEESKQKNKEWHLGRKHTLETRKKMAESRIGEKNPNYGKRHTEEIRKKMKENWNYEKHFTKETKRKISEDLIKRWKDEKFKNKTMKKIMSTNAKKPTKPERIMIEIIKENNLPFNYVGNGQVILGGFNPDFLSKNPKHIIEVFGDYWHNLPKIKERDKKRLKTYKKYGYKTLIIWEHELENTQQIINKIREEL